MDTFLRPLLLVEVIRVLKPGHGRRCGRRCRLKSSARRCCGRLMMMANRDRSLVQRRRGNRKMWCLDPQRFMTPPLCFDVGRARATLRLDVTLPGRCGRGGILRFLLRTNAG